MINKSINQSVNQSSQEEPFDDESLAGEEGGGWDAARQNDST